MASAIVDREGPELLVHHLLPRTPRTRPSWPTWPTRFCLASVVVSIASLLALLGVAPSASAASAPVAAPSAAASGSYTPDGVPISGARNAAGGTTLAKPGQYTDVLESGSSDTSAVGSAKYYTVELHKGDKAFFTATMVTPPKPTSGTSVELEMTLTSLQSANAYDCRVGDDTNYQSETGNLISPLTVVVATGQVGGVDWDSHCPSNGPYVVKVSRSGDAYRADPTPLELGFHLEPTVVSSGVPGIAAPGSDLPVSGADALRDVTAGFSYDSAPLISAGRYQDSISSGQTRYFRIPLDWGQRVAFLVNSTQVAQNNGAGAWATAALYSPVRSVLYLAEKLPDDGEPSFGGTDGSLSGTSQVVLRYANRESSNDQIVPYSIAGDYYLSLSLGFADNGTSLTVPYTMILNIVGRAEAGPSYSYPAGASAPPSSSKSTATLWLLVAVVVVAAVVVGWLILVRRRPAHGGAKQPNRTGGSPTGRGSAPTTGIPAGTALPRPTPPGARPSQPPFPPGQPGPPPSGPAPPPRR